MVQEIIREYLRPFKAACTKKSVSQDVLFEEISTRQTEYDGSDHELGFRLNPKFAVRLVVFFLSFFELLDASKKGFKST